ncbi:MAG: FCD domain-containing protein [Pseudomonadota bacterium]
MDESITRSESVFEPIDVDRVADAVVDQIEDLILAGVLRPGQKLPPERALSETLDVSRPKLREAIHVLEERGLLRIRRNEGAFVEPLTGEVLTPAMLALCTRHRGAFFDFLEYRRDQEAFAAHLAAHRATPADHEALYHAIEAMEAGIEGGSDSERTDLDLSFHMAVAAAAHNAILMHTLRAIYALMTRGAFHDTRRLYGAGATREELLRQHRAIAEAVEAGDAERAAAAAEAHVDYVERTCRTAEDEHRRERIARKRLRLTRLADFGTPPRRRRPA